MPGKSGSAIAANLHVGHAQAGEDVGEDGPPSAVHGVDGELHAGFFQSVEAGKVLNGLEIGGQEIDFLTGAGCAARATG